MSRHGLQMLVIVPALVLSGCGGGESRESSGKTSSRPSPWRIESSASAEPPELTAKQQAAVDAQLRVAAWANDLKRAATLIRSGADVNAKDDTEQSAYLIATSEGYVDLLDLTLDNGAQINAKDSFNGTGLIRAAERGHALVVGRLLQTDIDRNHVNRLGYQAIHEAVWLGKNTTAYVDTVRVLVAGDVELTRASDREGLTPAQMATQREYPRLEAVLTQALDPAKIDNPDAVLLEAAQLGNPDEAARALRAGADLEAQDSLQRTPLLLAVTHDRVDVARLLIAMGANPNALDHQHDTPWLVSGVTGSPAMLKALLPAKPDFTILNRYGGTSLIPASERGHVEYVRQVLETGIDIDHVNNLGWTALLEAVILGDGGQDHQEIVQLLLDAGADRSIPDKDGVTALEHAQARGFTTIERLLR